MQECIMLKSLTVKGKKEKDEGSEDERRWVSRYKFDSFFIHLLNKHLFVSLPCVRNTFGSRNMALKKTAKITALMELVF